MPRRLRVRFRSNRAPLRSAKEGEQARDVFVWFYSDSAKIRRSFIGQGIATARRLGPVAFTLGVVTFA